MTGTLRNRDAEVARQTILDAAEAEFAESGYAGGRIDAIAARSGYNKALIFHYFGDKLGLYKAVVSCIKSSAEFSLIERTRDYFADPHVAEDRAQVQAFLTVTARNLYDKLVTRPKLRQMLIWEAANGWQTYAKIASETEMGQTYLGKVRDFLARAQANGIIRADIDLEVLIAQGFGLVLIYLTSLPRYQSVFPDKDFASPDALAAAREQLVNMLVRGALTPEPAS